MELLATNYAGIFRYEDMEVEEIFFYNDNGIICRADSKLKNAVLNHEEKKLEEKVIFDFLYLAEKPTKRLKENFTCKDNFYIRKAKKDYSSFGRCSLYLYVDNDNIILEKNDETFVDIVDLETQEIKTTYELHTLKGKIVDNSVYVTTVERPTQVTLASIINNETVDTPLGIKAREIQERLKKESYITISSYDLVQILKVADITFKDEQNGRNQS